MSSARGRITKCTSGIRSSACYCTSRRWRCFWSRMRWRGRGLTKDRQLHFRADLIEHATQFVKVDRLGQMKIEARFLAAANIFVAAETGQRDTGDGLFTFYFRNDVV